MYIKIAIPERFQLKLMMTLQNMLLPQRGDIHYIGGGGGWPPPLQGKDKKNGD